MACSIDKNKINTAITEKITSIIEESNNFTIEGSAFIPQGQDSKKTIEEINKSFKDDVIGVDLAGNYTVVIPEQVTNRYLFSQPDASEQILQTIRQIYLKQFADGSLNLLADDYWLNHPVMENPTIQKLFAFAKKINPNFKISEVENLNQNAVALIRDYIILVRDGKLGDELPEEVAHFFVALLPEGNEMYTSMMKDILNYKVYGETYEKYKNNPAYQKDGKPNIEKIKKEAVGKLISEYIKNAFYDKADQEYRGKRSFLKGIVKSILNFLKKAFRNLSSKQYTEPINYFKKSADQILEGDVSLLDLQKSVDVYDSVFYSAVEEAKDPLHEGSTIAKSAYQMTKTVGVALRKKFFTFMRENQLTGLEELLKDPNFKEFNVIWDVIDLLTQAETDFGFLRENFDAVQFREAARKLSEAYHELEQIPKALEIIKKRLEKEKQEKNLTESDFANRISEVQKYLHLSEMFRTITERYTNMLREIKDAEGNNNENPFYNTVFEDMMTNIGNIQHRFTVADEGIYNILKDYLLEIAHNHTNELFDKYTKTLKSKEQQIETEHVKIALQKKLKENILSKDQLRHAINGTLPQETTYIDEKGKVRKYDLSKIKDASNVDYFIFMFGGTSTMSDPFISTAMGFYIKRVLAYHQKTQEEQRNFANKIMPFIKKLSVMHNMDYYESQKALQTVQDFYDENEDSKSFKRRTLLSQMNRFDFQFEKISMEKNMEKLRFERSDLQLALKNKSISDDDKTKYENRIEEINKTLDKMVDEYSDFMDTYAHRRYTPAFYKAIKLLEANKGDSTALKELKKVEQKILALEKRLSTMSAAGVEMVDATFDKLSRELADLYTERIEHKSKLPERDANAFKEYEKLYEDNEEATERVALRHKHSWLKTYLNFLRAVGETITPEIERDAEQRYNRHFLIIQPTQAYFDEMKDINGQIDAINNRNDLTITLKARKDELENKRKSLLSSIRNYRRDVSISALMSAKTPEGELAYRELSKIESELDHIENKLRIAGAVNRNASSSDVEFVSALMDINFAFDNVIDDHDADTDELMKLFSPYFDITPSIIETIKQTLRKKESLNNILPLLKTKSEVAEKVIKVYKLNDIDEFFKESNIKRTENTLRQMYKLDKSASDKLTVLYAKRESLRVQMISNDYRTGPLQFIIDTMNEVMSLPDGDLLKNRINTTVIENKLGLINKQGGVIFETSKVEELLADGLFEEILKYLDLKNTPQSHEMMRFLAGIHKKTAYHDVTKISPRYFLTKTIPTDPNMFTIEYPNFLKRRKVREFMEDKNGKQVRLTTERVNELDPEVIAGNKEATVDINGEWLPRAEKFVKDEDGNIIKKDGKDVINRFWNRDYEVLKNGKDEKSKTLFALLQEFTQFYLQKQVDSNILPGNRLDLVMPSRMNDKFENTKLHLTSVSEWWKIIKERINNGKASDKSENVSAETRNYNEELGIVTKENVNIYNGTILSTNAVKLDSKRRIPVQRVSQDILSSLMYFIGDANEYQAKSIAAPIFQSFSDIFRRSATQKNGKVNKNRADIFQALTDIKMYDIKPDNFMNNPILARMLSVINNLATRKLMFDPLGAAINLIGGQSQMLIHAGFDKNQISIWLTNGLKATDWARIYVRDTFGKHNLSKECQLATALGFLPDSIDMSKRMSNMNIMFDFRHIAMSPRSLTEVQMAMHLGLTLLESTPIKHNGKVYKWEDIYQVNKKTGNIELIEEFQNDEDLRNKYNLVDGTEVDKFRLKMVGTYTLIQGNYYKFNSDYMSATAVGRTMELMKRWFITGYTKRWQGTVLDHYTGTDRDGSHYAMWHLLKELFIAAKKGNFQIAKDYWKIKTPQQKLALEQSLAEILYILVSGVLVLGIMLGYDDDDEDKNKKLKDKSWIEQILVLIGLRITSELGTYIPLPFWGLGMNEVQRYMFDPFSSGKTTLSNISAIATLALYHVGDMMGMVTHDEMLYYQRNEGYWYKEEGDKKIWAKLLNLLGHTNYTLQPEPYIKTLTQIQNKI